MLENRREFLWAEAARLTGTAFAVAATGGWFGARDPRVAAAIAAFLAVSLLWLLVSARVEARRPAAAATA